MDIIDWEMNGVAAKEDDTMMAALHEARLNQAYANLAAEIKAQNAACFPTSGQSVQIYGDFLHPFFLMVPHGH